MGAHRRPQDIIRDGPQGVERNCRSCRQWLLQNEHNYYRAHAGTRWQSECRGCLKKRDRERGIDRRRKSPCVLAEVLGLIPRR